MTKINPNQLGSINLTQPKKVFTPINRKPTDNVPKSKAWLNNISGKTVDDKKPETPKEKFWVTKSGDSSKISDEVLKKHFNFDDEDVKAYTEKNGKFTVTDSGKCETAVKNNKVCVAATKADILGKTNKSGKLVGGWKTENGKVAVTLSTERVKELQNFRQERVIDKAVNQISDDNIRNQVRNDLRQITIAEGSKTEAANRLMYLDKVSETDSAKVREAINTVANQPENKNNPLTNLVSAKINLDEAIKNKDARKFSDAEVRMNKAVKLVQGQDTMTGEYKKDAKVNREEAAFVNKQVSQTMRSIGRTGEANERETLARYYEVDDKERNSALGFPLGEIDRWKKSDTPSMRPLSQTEIDLREYQEQYSEEPIPKKNLGEDKFKQEWKKRNYVNENGRYVPDEKGGAVQQGFSRYNMKGSLRVSGTELVTMPVYKNENGLKRNSRQQYFRGQNKETIIKGQESIKLSYESPELNPRGINKAFGTTSKVDGLGLINRYVPFGANMYYQKTEKQLAYRFGLEKQHKVETKYPVPPKPEDLQKERTKLTRLYGNDPKGKAIVNEMMQNLEVKSHAFWNR
jgi:hypothetical protein